MPVAHILKIESLSNSGLNCLNIFVRRTTCCLYHNKCVIFFSGQTDKGIA